MISLPKEHTLLLGMVYNTISNLTPSLDCNTSKPIELLFEPKRQRGVEE